MTPEEILSHPPRVLSQRDREFYFENGYVHVEGVVPADEVATLRAAMNDMIAHSRSVTASNEMFVLSPGHTAAAPRLRRLEPLADGNPVFWRFIVESIEADLVADVVGPDVRYWTSMLNTKWGGGGEAVGWHQDIAFDPHTNFNCVQSLLHLDDVTEDQGPLLVVPGSHRGPVFDHYDASGRWTGAIPVGDLGTIQLEDAVGLPGPAGSVTVVHCRLVHGSRPNASLRLRPLLVTGYTAADSIAYGPQRDRGGGRNRYSGRIVRGHEPTHAHHEAIRMRLPPDWSRGYTSIYEHQHAEGRSAERAG